METKTEVQIHDLSQELKLKLDKLLERVTGSYCVIGKKSGTEYTADREAMNGIMDRTLKDGIHPAAFYVYEELVKDLLNRQCVPAAYSSMFSLLGALKTRLWAAPLMQVSVIIRERFFEYLYYLSQFTQNYFRIPTTEEELEDHVKTYLGYYQMMFNTYSCDLPMIGELWAGNPLKVQCSQCGSILTEEALTLCGQCEGKPEREDLPREWDVLHTMLPWLSGCNEKQLDSFLHFIYSSYRCPDCGEENSILEGYKKLRYQTLESSSEPEAALVEWLLTFGESKLHESQDKMLFLHKQALAYLFQMKQSEPLLLARCISRVATDYTFACQFRLEIGYAQWAVALLESLSDESYGNDKKLQLAEAYRRLGVAYNADFQHPENNFPERTAECYEKALRMFDEVLGAGNEKSATVKTNMLILKLDLGQDAGKEIQLVKEQIEIEKGRENPDEEKIADSCRRIAEAYANCMDDYEQGAQYYDYYLQWAKKEYGDESDFVADCYDELAEIYETGGDFENAGKYYEMALEINIREMGRIYTLPPLFKKLLTGILKKAGKIDESDKFDRSISASDSYIHVGELQMKSGNLKKAIHSFEKAISLRKWVMRKPNYQLGRIYQRMGTAYEKLGQGKAAQKQLHLAFETYRQVIADNEKERNSPYQAHLAMEIEDCENAIKEILNNDN